MCQRCGEGWRFETVRLDGDHSGEVKAVLHPIKADWEELYSAPGTGTITLALEDNAVEDIWPGSTGLYISQVLPDGTRLPRFGAIIDKDQGAGGGDGTVAFTSIESFLNSRLVAGPNDPYGIDVSGATISVVKPTSPTTTTTIYTAPFNGTQADFCAFLVRVAQGNLVGDGFRGIPTLNAVDDLPNTITYDQDIAWWEFANIGKLIFDLVGAENGVKYWLEHTYANRKWSTMMHFADTIGDDRTYTIMSDRESLEYGLTIDATDKATRVYGIGSGTEGNTQFSIAYDEDETDNLPEHQATQAWKDQTVPTLLDSLTRGYVADHRDPITVPSASLMGLPDYDPDDAWYDPQKGFPGPEICRPGDTFTTSIGYGWITTRELPVRNLGVSWSLVDPSPAERVIAMQPMIRANTSVRTQVPAKAPAPEQPVVETQREGNPTTVTPWPVKGKVFTISGSVLDEVSGMEVSAKNPGNVYVHPDEVQTSQVLMLNAKTGAKTGSHKFSTPLNGTYGDPEWIRGYRKGGQLVLGDTGDNDQNRPTSGSGQPALYVYDEPKGTGGKTVTVKRCPIKYPGSAKWNVECGLIDPDTGDVYLVTKEEGRAQVFAAGPIGSLSTSNNNVTLVATLDGIELVTDGTFTFEGGFILFRSKSKSDTVVYHPSWHRRGFIPTPSMSKSEAIAVESACSFLSTSDVKNGDAPVYRVLIPKDYGATCGTVAGPTGSGTGGGTSGKTRPGQVLNLSDFKITLPIGSGNKPKEVDDLATFEIKPWFYTDDGATVVFRANVDGVTTSGSSYPRSELRQMKNGDEAAWSNKTQTWTMEAELAFTHLPGTKPHVVGMQIHDGNDDVTVLRLENNDLYVTRGDDTHFDLIDGSYTLGDFIRVKVVAKAGGGIDWYLNGTKVATVPGVFSGLYFKAGVYPQANESNGTGYGETKFRSLKVTRS